MTTINQRGGPFSQPSADVVANLRSSAGWTQAQAAQVLKVGIRTYQRWEDPNDTSMPANCWELMKIRAA